MPLGANASKNIKELTKVHGGAKAWPKKRILAAALTAAKAKKKKQVNSSFENLTNDILKMYLESTFISEARYDEDDEDYNLPGSSDLYDTKDNESDDEYDTEDSEEDEDKPKVAPTPAATQAHYRQLGQYDPLSKPEEMDLFSKMHTAHNKVLDTLCKFGIALPVVIAKLQEYKTKGIGILTVITPRRYTDRSGNAFGSTAEFEKYLYNVDFSGSKGALKRLKDLHDQTSKAYNVTVSSDDDPAVDEAHKTVKLNIREIAAILKTLSLKNVVIEKIVEDVKARIAKDLRGDVVKLEDECWMDSDEVVDQLKNLTTTYANYFSIRDKILSHNARHVGYIAQRVIKRNNFTGLNYDEVESAGWTGMMRAVESYNPNLVKSYERGGVWHETPVKLTTYATKFIDGAAVESIYGSKLIQIPKADRAKLKKIARVTADSKDNTPHEVLAQRSGFTLDEYNRLMQLKQNAFSLNTAAGEEGDDTLMDKIRDEQAEIADKGVLDRKPLLDKTLKIMKMLAPHELDLADRFYNFSDPTSTLAAGIHQQILNAQARIKSMKTTIKDSFINTVNDYLKLYLEITTQVSNIGNSSGANTAPDVSGLVARSIKNPNSPEAIQLFNFYVQHPDFKKEQPDLAKTLGNSISNEAALKSKWQGMGDLARKTLISTIGTKFNNTKTGVINTTKPPAASATQQSASTAPQQQSSVAGGSGANSPLGKI